MTPRCILHHGVALWKLRCTGEAIAKKMNTTTAFKGTILQKTSQNLTLLSYSMINANLKFFKVGSFKLTRRFILTLWKRFHIRISLWIFGKNQNRHSVPIMGPGEAIWWKNQHQKISWHCPLNIIINTTACRQHYFLEELSKWYISVNSDYDSPQPQDWYMGLVWCDTWFGLPLINGWRVFTLSSEN